MPTIDSAPATVVSRPALNPPPEAGTVTIEAGPFTDRLEVTNAVLNQGEHPTVSASIRNLVDVSDLILLEVRVDFYDAQGRYVGSGNAAYADEEYAGDGAVAVHESATAALTVKVASSAPLTGVNSAIVAVPQLVNE